MHKHISFGTLGLRYDSRAGQTGHGVASSELFLRRADGPPNGYTCFGVKLLVL